MKRDAESRLLDFCAKQHRRFATAEWVGFRDVGPMEMAAVARYLAGVEWYGHRSELVEVAERFTSQRFAELSEATGFDAGRFGGLLKARLARPHAAA